MKNVTAGTTRGGCAVGQNLVLSGGTRLRVVWSDTSQNVDVKAWGRRLSVKQQVDEGV